MDYSNDPMLQLRNFSYFDTQISRLGGVNFNELPINRSVCPFISTIRDGQHQERIMAGPNYYPKCVAFVAVPGVQHLPNLPVSGSRSR